jgi:hypothetical protein
MICCYPDPSHPDCGPDKVYHNDFIGNTSQTNAETNKDEWDDGYPSGCNYWSDYAGVDDYSGPGQNVSGSDGIGDTPYVFPNDQDNYPLMTPLRPWPRVIIDIEPGSDPDCFNNDGKGVIPVAILGSDDFDVTRIDPGWIQLAGLDVKVAGKSDKLLAHIEDVNGDDYDDLTVQI